MMRPTATERRATPGWGHPAASVLLIALAVGAAFWIYSLHGAAPSRSCPAAGIFVGRANVKAEAAVALQLGTTTRVMAIYAGPPDWTSFNSNYIPDTTQRLVLAVGAITRAQAAAIGHDLVAAGHPNTIIRIMWEMNGYWYPWGTQAISPAQYVTAYRSIEAGFSTVPGNHFVYVWNLNAGSGGTREFATYPGNSVVSNIGIDWYAQNGSRGAPATTIPPILAFAAAHHKPISFDEWGVDGQPDAATYISYLSQVAHDPTNRVSFQIYFDYASSRITSYPRDVAAYKALFSRGC
jgi:beta-mannanase